MPPLAAQIDAPGPSQASSSHVTESIELHSVIFASCERKVWLAHMEREQVVAKTFGLSGEHLRRHELDILKCLPDHENVIRFIGDFNVFDKIRVQPALVMPYYSLGSLFHYLDEEKLDVSVLITLTQSLVHGMKFLHEHEIAHRDVKSKNILVDHNNGQYNCVITDLGHAIRRDHLPFRNRFLMVAGTTRYRAPELLVANINLRTFDLKDFQKCDIYSLGLVLWELAFRTEFSYETCTDEGLKTLKTLQSQSYQPPYYDALIQTIPTVPKMRQLVIDECTRPVINDEWKFNAVMAGLSEIMTQCWSHDPQVRPQIAQVQSLVEDLINRMNE